MITKYRNELLGTLSKICRFSTVARLLVLSMIDNYQKEKTLKPIARLHSCSLLAVESSHSASLRWSEYN